MGSAIADLSKPRPSRGQRDRLVIFSHVRWQMQQYLSGGLHLPAGAAAARIERFRIELRTWWHTWLEARDEDLRCVSPYSVTSRRMLMQLERMLVPLMGSGR
jgi:hypothetical protein